MFLLSKKNKEKRNYINIWAIVAFGLSVLTVIAGGVLLYLYPLLAFRWYLIGILTIITLLLGCGLKLTSLKKAKRSQIALIVIAFIFAAGVGALDYYYYRTVNTMSDISTENGDIIHSYLYVKKDSSIKSLDDLKGKSVAVQPETSVTMYEMFVEGITQKNYQTTDFILTPYSTYQTAFEAYLQDEVEAIVLDEQSITMLKEIYPELTSENMVIDTYQRIVEIEKVENIDTSKDPFTILINGVDIRSGDLGQAANADVIMLATFNPQTMKLSLNSIPRDSYLPVTCRGFRDKITHSGSGGVQCTISSLEEAFDIKIDYYVKVNFFAVVDLVDALGGIEVDVPFAFTEQDEHDNQDAITLEEGLQTLNGSEALALARHRKTLPNGDISRGLNQQLVIQGILQKAASSAGVLNVDKLLSVVGDNVQTNMPTSQMYSLFQMLTNLGSSSRYGNLSALNIQMNTIEGTGAMFSPEYTDLELYFYMPYQDSMNSTTRDIRRILGEEDYPLPTNTFAFNANVAFEDISETSKDYMDNDKIARDHTTPEIPEQVDNRQTTMPEFSGATYASIYNWCNAVDAELPDGYYMSCSFESEDGSPIQDDAVFVSSSIRGGQILSSATLSKGSNSVHFVVRNPVVHQPEPPVTPEEPEQPEPPVTPEEPEVTPPDENGGQENTQ